MSVAANGLRAVPAPSGAPGAPDTGGAGNAPYGTLESTSLHHGGNYAELLRCLVLAGLTTGDGSLGVIMGNPSGMKRSLAVAGPSCALT